MVHRVAAPFHSYIRKQHLTPVMALPTHKLMYLLLNLILNLVVRLPEPCRRPLSEMLALTSSAAFSFSPAAAPGLTSRAAVRSDAPLMAEEFSSR